MPYTDVDVAEDPLQFPNEQDKGLAKSESRATSNTFERTDGDGRGAALAKTLQLNRGDVNQKEWTGIDWTWL
ncbi:hypothetical protein CEXT_213261 [Caerostris extrusa]|uniref:Uncharacterized protein n=1 Tax=Caerostris extrusa TaxID=172846 RepID=A0AAV4NDY5_CAEEX|nr:hypothetical protein CEXT_213261 [Caerostris extrusa]